MNTFFHFRPNLLIVPARVLLFATLMSGLTSCAYLKEAIGLGPARPKVTLQGIEVKYVTLQALTLLVSIKVENPNGFDLVLKNLNYDLHSLDLKLASGAYGKRITVPKNQSSLVKLPVAVNPNHAMTVIRKIMAQGTDVQATVKASADFESPFGDMDVSFEQTKSLAELASM